MNGMIPDIGEQLRAARVSRGLDIKALANELCICSRQLHALENNLDEALPPQVYAVGFLRTYAARLGLDADHLADQYRLLHGDVGTTNELHFPEPIRETRIPALSLLAGGIGALLAIYAAWTGFGSGDVRQAALVPAPPENLVAMIAGEDESRVDRLVVAASESLHTLSATVENATARVERNSDEIPNSSAAAAPAENVLTADASPVAEDDSPSGGLIIGSAMASETRYYAPSSASRVQILARADTWVMITDSEDRLLMEGVIRSGERYSPPTVTGLKLSASNAAGLEVIVDGRPVKGLGEWGDVVSAVPLDGDAIINPRLN